MYTQSRTRAHTPSGAGTRVLQRTTPSVQATPTPALHLQGPGAAPEQARRGGLSSPKPRGPARPRHCPLGEVGREPRLADRPSSGRRRGRSQRRYPGGGQGARPAGQQSLGKCGGNLDRGALISRSGVGTWGRPPRDPRRPRCPRRLLDAHRS